MSRAIDKQLFFKKINYKPHRKQVLFHQSDARFRIPCCGRRFGKSVMAARDEEPGLMVPNRRGWIVGPTYDLGEKEFRVMWDDLIIGRGLGRDKRIKKAYSKRSGEMYIEFPWQNRVEVRSAEHPEHLVGESLDWVIMSEAAKHKKDTFERYIRPSLADRRGRATFPSTPEGLNWYYDLYQLGRNPSVTEYIAWRFPSWENPVVYPGGRGDDEIALLERSTTTAWFNQEIGAEFTAFVGKIFEEWNDNIHVKPHVFRPDWPNYVGVDWGWTRPFAFIEFQVSPWDTVHVWREYYEPYKTLEEHIEQIRLREDPVGYHLDMAFADAAEPQSAAYMSKHLVPTVADPNAKKDRTTRFELMGRFIKLRPVAGMPVAPRCEGTDVGSYPAPNYVDEYGTPNEVPGLTVDPTCTSTIKEFNDLRAPDAPSGNKAVELRAKSADHSVDAVGYGLMHLYGLGADGHLSDVKEIYIQQGLVLPRSTDSPLLHTLELVDATSTYGPVDSVFAGPVEGGVFTMGMNF